MVNILVDFDGTIFPTKFKYQRNVVKKVLEELKVRGVLDGDIDNDLVSDIYAGNTYEKLLKLGVSHNELMEILEGVDYPEIHENMKFGYSDALFELLTDPDSSIVSNNMNYIIRYILQNIGLDCGVKVFGSDDVGGDKVKNLDSILDKLNNDDVFVVIGDKEKDRELAKSISKKGKKVIFFKLEKNKYFLSKSKAQRLIKILLKRKDRLKDTIVGKKRIFRIYDEIAGERFHVGTIKYYGFSEEEENKIDTSTSKKDIIVDNTNESSPYGPILDKITIPPFLGDFKLSEGSLNIRNDSTFGDGLYEIGFGNLGKGILNDDDTYTNRVGDDMRLGKGLFGEIRSDIAIENTFSIYEQRFDELLRKNQTAIKNEYGIPMECDLEELLFGCLHFDSEKYFGYLQNTKNYEGRSFIFTLICLQEGLGVVKYNKLIDYFVTGYKELIFSDFLNYPLQEILFQSTSSGFSKIFDSHILKLENLSRNNVFIRLEKFELISEKFGKLTISKLSERKILSMILYSELQLFKSKLSEGLCNSINDLEVDIDLSKHNLFSMDGSSKEKILSNDQKTKILDEIRTILDLDGKNDLETMKTLGFTYPSGTDYKKLLLNLQIIKSKFQESSSSYIINKNADTKILHLDSTLLYTILQMFDVDSIDSIPDSIIQKLTNKIWTISEFQISQNIRYVFSKFDNKALEYMSDKRIFEVVESLPSLYLKTFLANVTEFKKSDFYLIAENLEHIKKCDIYILQLIFINISDITVSSFLESVISDVFGMEDKYSKGITFIDNTYKKLEIVFRKFEGVGLNEFIKYVKPLLNTKISVNNLEYVLENMEHISLEKLSNPGIISFLEGNSLSTVKSFMNNCKGLTLSDILFHSSLPNIFNNRMYNGHTINLILQSISWIDRELMLISGFEKFFDYSVKSALNIIYEHFGQELVVYLKSYSDLNPLFDNVRKYQKLPLIQTFKHYPHITLKTLFESPYGGILEFNFNNENIFYIADRFVLSNSILESENYTKLIRKCSLQKINFIVHRFGITNINDLLRDNIIKYMSISNGDIVDFLFDRLSIDSIEEFDMLLSKGSFMDLFASYNREEIEFFMDTFGDISSFIVGKVKIEFRELISKLYYNKEDKEKILSIADTMQYLVENALGFFEADSCYAQTMIDLMFNTHVSYFESIKSTGIGISIEQFLGNEILFDILIKANKEFFVYFLERFNKIGMEELKSFFIYELFIDDHIDFGRLLEIMRNISNKQIKTLFFLSHKNGILLSNFLYDICLMEPGNVLEIDIVIELFKNGVYPTDNTVSYILKGGEIDELIAIRDNYKKEGTFDKNDPLHRDLEYFDFRVYVDRVTSGNVKYDHYIGFYYKLEYTLDTITNKEDFVQAGYESYLGYSIYERLKERRKKQMKLVSNLSYGKVITEPFSEDINNIDGDDLIQARIGSTECHGRISYINIFLFSEHDIIDILRGNKDVLIFDGTKNESFPDSNIGYYSYFFVLNYVLYNLTGDSKYLEGYNETFVKDIMENREFEPLMNILTKIIRKSKVDVNSIKPFKFIYVSQNSGMKYKTKHHDPEDFQETIDLSDYEDKNCVFYTDPVDRSVRFGNHQGFFDDTEIVSKTFFLGMKGVEYVFYDLINEIRKYYLHFSENSEENHEIYLYMRTSF